MNENTGKGSTAQASQSAVKWGIGLFIAFVLWKLLLSGDSNQVSCQIKSDGLGGTVMIDNGCDFPINAVNCREYTYRDPYCHFKQYKAGENMDALSNGSILVDAVFPSVVYTYACRVGYLPLTRTDDKARYSCIKGNNITPRSVTRGSI